MLLKQRLFAAEKIFRPNKGPLAIAFLDTGISPVADFTHPKNRIIAFLDLVGGKTAPYDDNGHGTHVAGISAANDNVEGTSVVGMAPEAQLVRQPLCS